MKRLTGLPIVTFFIKTKIYDRKMKTTVIRPLSYITGILVAVVIILFFASQL